MTKEYPEVTIPYTENRTLFSSIVNQEYRISVALPFSYSSTNDYYPVLFFPDALASFGSITETSRGLSLLKEIPEAIIVGIDYPVSDLREALGFRFRDLTPSDDNDWLDENIEGFSKFFGVENLETDGTGGANKFFQFIQEELMPFIEGNYRVNPDDKALSGGSLGGLFALYVLFHQPNAFNRYLIASPSIWWDNNVTFEYEEKYSAENTDLTATVFMSVESLEEPEDESSESGMRTNMLKLSRKLEDRNYKNLRLKTHVFDDETHASVGPAAISRGLRVIFE
jgi:predicted alpha/beta superfamily hydrolase